MGHEPTRADFEAEFARIGYRVGEEWPMPADINDPAALLALLRSVSDGAGLDGWRAVLARQGGAKDG